MAKNRFRYQYEWANALADTDMSQPSDRARALKLARSIMRRARENIEQLVENLRATKYRFVRRSWVHKPPDDDTSDRLDWLESAGVRVPISYRAWCEEVGSVCLMGSHRDWNQPAYVFKNTNTENGVLYTDPLVIWGVEAVEQSYKEWWERIHEFQDYTPLRVGFAPDEFHKANVSGGGPYEIACDRSCVDSIVLNERHSIGFVAYLRIVFEWGGFPGFEMMPDAPHEFIHELKKGLLPI